MLANRILLINNPNLKPKSRIGKIYIRLNQRRLRLQKFAREGSSERQQGWIFPAFTTLN